MRPGDPRLAAAQWLDDTLQGAPVPPLLLVLGLGDGALLDVLDARAPLTRVLALEPDPAQATAFRRRDWTTRERDGRLLYLVDPDYAGADDAWRMFPPTTDAPTVLTHPAVAANPGPGAVRAARVLKRIVFGAQANATARQQFAPRYLTNSLRNLPAMLAGRDVRALAGAFAGRPAIVAAAGPSLDAVVSDLCTVHERAVLIAVDTALRPLLHAGARPHLAVGLDPSELNARHFHALPPCPETWLVSESALDGAAHRHFGNRTFWFRVANHEPWPWYQALGLDVGQIEVWGSVVTAAFQVAVLAGCDPIVFVGTDLGYTDGRPYARATTYEFEWARRVAEGADLEMLWQAWTRVHTPVEATDLAGRPTTTSAPLLAFRDWLVSQAGRSGRRVVNATGAGIFFGQGVEQMTLAEVLRDAPAGAPPVVPDGLLLETRTRSRTDAHAAVRGLRQALASGEREAAIERFAAFSGGGWDATATAAALDDALAQFEGAGGAEAKHQAPLQMPLLRQLPEAVGRWRHALRGVLESRSNGPDVSEASALLATAATRIHEMVMSAAREGGPFPALGAAEDVSPLSARAPWPASALWPLQAVEATLGHVVQRAWTPPGFFSRPTLLREKANEPRVPQAGDLLPADSAGLSHLCALLALQWAAVVVDMQQADESVAACQRHALDVTAASMVPADNADATIRGSLVVDRLPGRVAPAVLRVALDPRRAARIETGTLVEGDSIRVPPVPVAAELEGQARVSLRLDSTPDVADGPPWRVSPRVLTDEGMPRASIAYVSGDEVTCVGQLTHAHSVRVRADGSWAAGHAWPRRVFNERPFAEHGVMAWGWTHPGPGYVMYRDAPEAEAVVERVPFVPVWSAPWNDRWYFTTTTTGLGAWAPGVEGALHFSDVTLLDVRATPEGLRLGLCTRDAQGALVRRRARHYLLWDGSGPPTQAVTEPYGGDTARARGDHGWTATVYPESDIVMLDSDRGRRVAMRCYYPFKCAWLGTSLLVSTIDSEVLLFEQLTVVLEAGA